MCMGRVECSGMASDKGAATACLLGRRTALERKSWLVCGFLCVYMLASACACACTSVQQKLRIWEKHELPKNEAARHCAATGFVLAYGWLFYIYSQGDQALRNCVLKGIKCLSECKLIAHVWPRCTIPTGVRIISGIEKALCSAARVSCAVLTLSSRVDASHQAPQAGNIGRHHTAGLR